MKLKKLSQNQLTNGTAWLAFGNITSRVLGALYVIPWTMMLGALSLQANTLMGKGYNLYQFFLMLSTAGLPSAVAKFTARLEGNSKHQFLKNATRLSWVAGFICCVALWSLAPILSASDVKLIPVLRSLSLAVLVFPFLSVLRGRLQGDLRMAEIAKSDVIEQVVRVAYMLGSAYVILQLQHGSWVTVVVHSTFAASIGAWVATLYLLFCTNSLSKKQLLNADFLKENSEPEIIDFKHIIVQSLPFVVIGGFLVAYQWIDQFSFHVLMSKFNPMLSSNKIETIFGLFNFNSNKLIMIVVSLSVSIASTILPLISKSRYNHEVLRKYISQAYVLFCAITLPACAALYSLSKPVYILFYGNYAAESLYIPMVQISAVIALFMGLTSVLAMILQGLSKTGIALRAIGWGMAVKILCQPIMIYLTSSLGALLSTFISLVIVTIIMGSYINHRFELLDFLNTKVLNAIYVSSFVLLILFTGLSLLSNHFVPDTRVSSGLFLALVGSLGGLLVLVIYQKCHVLDVLKNR
ncbi:oligosaccharide flippase family protein [Leuconostoc mesenteroides]|uniref:oligosaccharide flippase family protein n=1 Tax=Leuconostoc mesenteroides TaxID=1245 RepID=UPI003870D3AE